MTGPLYPPFYPPAYPVAPGLPAVPERLYVDGSVLNTVWCEVEGLESLLSPAGRRGENVIVPGRHGVIRSPRKRYDAAEVVIPMHVKGVNRATGMTTSRAAAQLYENIDLLLSMFHRETVELRYVRANGTARVATAELMTDPVVVTRERSWPPLARVSVALMLVDAFWVDTVEVSQLITGASSSTPHSLNAFRGSTAPITDARVTFFGPVSNPRIAIGDRWLQFNGVIGAGRELLLDCEHWHASPGAGADWTTPVTQVYREPGPEWLEIPPSPDSLDLVFTHTGGGSASVEIAGHRKFLSP